MMKVYLASEFGSSVGTSGDAGKGGSSGEIQHHMKRRLLSYWYHHKGDEPSEEVVIAKKTYGLDLFLDSGAFTAFTKKVVILPKDYAAYVHKAKQYFTVISSLDAIGDAVESYRIFRELQALGCDVAPVFHAREDLSWLVKYLDEGHPYILIGGMVPETSKWLLGWLDHLFEHYLTNRDGTPRVKLHGFGLTDQRLMFRYPWHSVDSASWIFTGVFGGCVFLTPAGLRKVTFTRESPNAKKIDAPHYDNLAPIHRREVDGWLEEYGFTAEQCRDGQIFRHTVNAITFTRMEALGTKTFHADYEGLFGS